MRGAEQRNSKHIPLGYFSGVHGIKGWLKVHSWTSPREAILEYGSWLIGDDLKRVKIADGRVQGKNIVVALPGINDRESAHLMVGLEIVVPRSELPEPQSGSWYWTDLEGLAVKTEAGEMLGQISKMIETGAHDVMVIRGEKEILVPFVPGVYVKRVDLDENLVVVDWDPEYLA